MLVLELKEVVLPFKAVLAAVDGIHKEDLAVFYIHVSFRVEPVRDHYSFYCRGDCLI